MTATETTTAERLLFIIHWGCVELRNLALGGAPHSQIADLADALEVLPKFVHDPEANWEMIEFVIRNYESKYPESGWRLSRRLEGDLPRWH